MLIASAGMNQWSISLWNWNGGVKKTKQSPHNDVLLRLKLKCRAGLEPLPAINRVIMLYIRYYTTGAV